MRIRTKPQRVDPEFAKDMQRLAQIRLSKGLAKFNYRELSIREMTRLLRRTEGYNLSKKELETKPKREDIR